MSAAAISTARWRENWRTLADAGATYVEVGRFGARRGARRRIRELEPGTTVVVSLRAPRMPARSRAFVESAGLEVEREYLAFPTATAPAYLVEDSPATVRLFLKDVLVAPPRAPLASLFELALAAVRATPWRLARAVAPGRVLIGRRT